MTEISNSLSSLANLLVHLIPIQSQFHSSGCRKALFIWSSQPIVTCKRCNHPRILEQVRPCCCTWTAK